MKTITPFRAAAALTLAIGLGGAGIAIAQSASDAAAAAEKVAKEAEDAIKAIDPTTGGESQVVDPSSTDPYGPQDDTGASPEPFEPGLPPLAEDELGSVEPAVETAAPERTPAIRMISSPTLPQPKPAVSTPTTSRPVAKRDPFTVNSILTLPPGPFRYGQWYWDESNAPKTGKLVITVDLDARVLSAFRDGHEIGTAVALLGTRKHPTPLGTFPILTKEKDNVSEKYNNAPMPWTLRLTWSGIAIHGSEVINGYASHGCVGVPNEFAEKLFAAAKRGDKVIITRGKMIGVGDKIKG